MLNRYQLRMYYHDGDKNTAGSKATEDCASILSSIGFQEISVPVYLNQPYKLFNVFQAVTILFNLFLNVKGKSTLVIQYPLLGINKHLRLIARGLKLKGCKLVVLIHDVDSLRHSGNFTTLPGEIDRLNIFDYVISHNQFMTAKLKEAGLTAKTVELDLFDYLADTGNSSVDQESVINKSIAFAGNLGKSEFLKDLGTVKNVNFELYGPGFDEHLSNDLIRWNGSFPPEKLPEIIQGGFGLIWDGNSVGECNGHMGEYLKYNNPHKASLYMVSGLPVIAPEHSAVGAFVRKNQLGFTVKSLHELENKINSISLDEYIQMKKNVAGIRGKLTSGVNLKRCIQETGL
ncbi:hypothetical protein [Pedobacter antarcticus]|uniref:hypothetical protein n=1 Tax=Pedobacter antarcticus TaxID=34086 RepID=UPI001C5A4D38|nr:hypothetical protein [Pedobacter antarcticus]